ncbi:hypothetical protein QAD02_021604 [Eretmocerus hayati]|uniref:Uncharacterized protein n=1 Tax=Eretmocerus hayati TaxID=131215 RepID=A0ACC2PSK7_9HYME|nr:hypothetical protein QAD02_021604 [Eretmocerus hayati]
MGSGGHPRCRNKCRSEISHSDRKKSNCEMRGLPKREDQWKYVYELIDLHNNPTAKVEKVGITYYLVANGKEMKICQTMFNDTFGMISSVIRTIQEKCGASESDQIVTGDLGGKHGNKDRVTSEVVLESTRTHTDTHEIVESHYRRSTNRNNGRNKGKKTRVGPGPPLVFFSCYRL